MMKVTRDGLCGDRMNIDSFEKAFDDHGGSCRIDCACGKIYYNPTGGWSWDDGELERLDHAPNAFALDYTPSYISFGGQTFAMDCQCWHPQAEQAMRFLDFHARKIAEYYRLEKERKQKEADAVPTI